MRRIIVGAPLAAAALGGMWLHYNVFDEKAPWAFISAVAIFLVVGALVLPLVRSVDRRW